MKDFHIHLKSDETGKGPSLPGNMKFLMAENHQERDENRQEYCS